MRIKRRWRIVLLIALLCALIALTLRPVIQSELQWRAVRDRGVLRVGIDPGWQPFSFDVGTGWQGFDADLAREIGQRLNLTIQPDPVGYDAMYDALQTSRTDIGVSVIVPDASRTADFAYSDSYFDAGPRLLARQAVADMNALLNQRVAVALGSDADAVLRYWARRVPGLVRVPLADDGAAIAALAQGNADAALVDVFAVPADIVDRGWMISSPQPKPYVIAVRVDNMRLVREVNRVLMEMKADGALQRIAKHWGVQSTLMGSDQNR